MTFASRIWRGLKYVVIDWTVSPRMLTLNERRPIMYQLVTTPVVTLMFASLFFAVVLSLYALAQLAASH